MDIISLHRNKIIGADEVDSPIMMAIASSGPGRGAVEFCVGDCDAVGGGCAGDEHLAADEGDFAVVDPDEVGAGEGEGVAAPDVLWVQVGDVDVSVLC